MACLKLLYFTYNFHVVEVGQDARHNGRLLNHQHLLDGIADVLAGGVHRLVKDLLAGAAQQALYNWNYGRIRTHAC